ncbi:glycoside hydrolase family 3 N-terminal domain-containing protein [Ilumatobacter sp.]|uniref:glycoside hydrolase family 3 N-terminal domain-containing protein n=1 Tax=Ilumatobacter sp. TaxID=1967498 RepID=UPI003C738FD9
MELDEKVAQLGSAWIFQIAGATGFDEQRAAPVLAKGIGHITRLSGAGSLGACDAAKLANRIQHHLAEHSRLGIPAIVHEEICSGLMASEATVFAQAIGVASTFRPRHNRRIADAIRTQMRAIGAHHGLSPVLDVCRDPRWGRLEETYGEDPYLVSRMGVEFVRGLQGDDLATGVVATAKHFVGYGKSDGGMNWAPAQIGQRELRDVYLRPFEHAVVDAGLASVMNAYHELDGEPCGASRWLFTDLLRDQWGFDGTVVSDYFAIDQLDDYHHLVPDQAAAAATALHAGIDVELPNTDCYGEPLKAAIARGELAMEDVDLAVSRVLTAKFRLGLFERSDVDVEQVAGHTRTPEQVELAEQVARDSLVLVKNDDALPLDAPARVAVLGPNADSARNLFGDYSYIAHVESLVDLLESGNNVFAMPVEHDTEIADRDLDTIETVLGALSSRLATSSIEHVPGCDVLSDDRSGFDAAVAAAAASDVAIMVMGDKSGLTDDCTTGESRDVASLDLPGVQEELVLAVAATGTPVVLVLVTGRPIGSVAVHEAAAAVLVAWLPGEHGAGAVADALTGVVSPGGKLPLNYPRHVGQIPTFHSHKVSGGRSHWKGPYVDISNEPMYPFGHGLSYSSFEVTVDPLDAPEASPGDIVDVVATVTNTGPVTADEVVQLYTRDPAASITRPVRELQGFERVTLDAAQSARITFHLPVDALGFSGPSLDHVIEPGRIEVFVGTSSTDLQEVGHLVIAGDEAVVRQRALSEAVTLEFL